MSFRATVRLVPLALGFLAGCQSGPPRPDDEALLATARARVKPIYDAYPKIAAAFPDSKEDKHCDDDALKKATPDDAGREVVTAYWGDLTQLAGKDLTDKEKADATRWTVTFTNQRLRNAKPFEKIDKQARPDASLTADMFEKRPYFAVMRFDSRSDGVAVDSEQMLSGNMRWTVAVFDIRKGEALCWMHVDVASSNTVLYQPGKDATEGAKVNAANDAIKRDLDNQVSKSVRESFPKMTSALTLPQQFQY
jgi:hypothetical protein